TRLGKRRSPARAATRRGRPTTLKPCGGSDGSRQGQVYQEVFPPERVMGSLYRPKYRASDGSLRESAVIWLKYRDALGVLRRESSEATKEQEARRLLKQREGAAVEGRVIVPRADRVTVAELAETLKADYKANGRRSADRLGFSLAHLLPYFGPRRAM